MVRPSQQFQLAQSIPLRLAVPIVRFSAFNQMAKFKSLALVPNSASKTIFFWPSSVLGKRPARSAHRRIRSSFRQVNSAARSFLVNGSSSPETDQKWEFNRCLRFAFFFAHYESRSSSVGCQFSNLDNKSQQ